MPLLGEFSALLTACCWSGSALAFSAAAVRVGPIRLNVTRLFIAAVLLLSTVVLTGAELNLSKSQLTNLAISGLVGLVFGDTFLFKAYEYIGPRLGMLIMSAAPIVGAVVAYGALGETIGWFGILGMVVTLGGIAIVVLERRESFSLPNTYYGVGIFYGFLGAVGQGVALVLAKMAFNEGAVNGFVATLIRITAAIVVIYPLAKFTGRYKNAVQVYLKDRKALLLTMLGAFLGPFLGITLSLIAVMYTTVGIAATLMATVPIMMLPLVRIIDHERLSWKAIAGAFLAVAGVAALFLR